MATWHGRKGSFQYGRLASVHLLQLLGRNALAQSRRLASRSEPPHTTRALFSKHTYVHNVPKPASTTGRLRSHTTRCSQQLHTHAVRGRFLMHRSPVAQHPQHTLAGSWCSAASLPLRSAYLDLSRTHSPTPNLVCPARGYGAPAPRTSRHPTHRCLCFVMLFEHLA